MKEFLNVMEVERKRKGNSALRKEKRKKEKETVNSLSTRMPAWEREKEEKKKLGTFFEK